MKGKIISGVIFLILMGQVLSFAQGKRSSRTLKEKRQYNLARRYEMEGYFNEALRIYQKLWDNNLRDYKYYLGVKNNLLNLKRYSEAILATEKMLKIYSNTLIEIELAEIYYKAGEKEKASQICKDIIARNKKSYTVYSNIASMLVKNQMIDEAIDVYTEARKNLPREPRILKSIADLYARRLDYKNATEMYLEYLKKSPRHYAMIEHELLSLARNIEDSKPIIDIVKREIKKQSDVSILMRKLVANLYMQSSEYLLALKEYEVIDEKLRVQSNLRRKYRSELLNFAENAERNGAYDYAKQAYEIFISRYPDSPEILKAQARRAHVLFLLKEYDQAIAAYEEIIFSYPQYHEAKKSYLEIGKIKLDIFNDPAGAKEDFSVILDKFHSGKDVFSAMFYLAECEIRIGKLDHAKEWYKKILRARRASDKIKERAQFHLALLNFYEGNFDLALDALKKLTEKKPLFDKQSSGFYVNDALELSFFIEENKQQQDLLQQYARCLLLIERRLYDQALANLKKLYEKKPDISFADEILMRIGELNDKLKNYQQAIKVYRTLIKNYPQSLNCDLAQKRIGEIYETRLKNINNAIKEYELVLTNYPESLLLEEVRKKIRTLENR